MSSAPTPEQRLAELGLQLPTVPAAAGNYVPYTRSGKLVFTAGALCLIEGKLLHTGKVGATVTLEEGYAAARACALQNLAVLREACGGDLGRVRRFLTVTGFVNAAPEFTDIPKVINGASDLFVAVFGEAGKHARTAVGAGSLPLGSAVETQVVVELVD